MQHSLRIFWQHTRWVAADREQDTGTAWIAIFALFQALGGNLNLGERCKDCHATIPRFKKQLDAFMSRSKQLIRDHGSDSTKVMIRRSNSSTHHLAVYGIRQHVPAVSARLCLSSHNATLVHNMLSTLQAASKSKRKTVLKLRAGAFKFPRLSPWRHLLFSCDDVLGNVLERREITRLNAIRSRGERGFGDDIKPTCFPLECPRCHTVSNMVGCKLYHLNRSRQIRCPSKLCNLTSTASKWLCPCKQSWLRCIHHRGPGFKCGSSGRSSSKASPDASLQNLSKRIKIIGPLGMHAESTGRIVDSTCIKRHTSSTKTSLARKLRLHEMSPHRFFARKGPYGQKKRVRN